MRPFVVAWLLAGCGFHTAASVDGAPSPIDAELDTPSADDAPTDTPVQMSAWTRRKAITIDNTKVSGGPHQNFPLLLRFANDPNLAVDALASGADIMFTEADGVTPLSYQRQRWIKGTGELIAWVKLPTLAAAAPTTIYLYYGNPTATDQQNVAGTWEAQYRGVWHLDDAVGGTGAIKDSSIYGNHGTDQNSPTLGVTGQIGNTITFDGIDDQIRIADSASLDATGGSGTFEMWIRFVDPSVANKYQLVLSNSNTFGAGVHDGYSWSTQPDGDHYFYPWAGDVNDYQVTTNPYSNNWTFAAVSYQFNTRAVTMYINGAAVSTTGMTATLWAQIANPADWLWGGNPGDPTNHFAGQLDELRVSTGVRGPGWILTEYRNQSSPQTFYTVGVATSL